MQWRSNIAPLLGRSEGHGAISQQTNRYSHGLAGLVIWLNHCVSKQLVCSLTTPCVGVYIAGAVPHLRPNLEINRSDPGRLPSLLGQSLLFMREGHRESPMRAASVTGWHTAAGDKSTRRGLNTSAALGFCVKGQFSLGGMDRAQLHQSRRQSRPLRRGLGETRGH